MCTTYHVCIILSEYIVMISIVLFFVLQVAMQADLRAMDATLSEHDRNTPKLIIETKE